MLAGCGRAIFLPLRWIWDWHLLSTTPLAITLRLNWSSHLCSDGFVVAHAPKPMQAANVLFFFCLLFIVVKWHTPYNFAHFSSGSNEIRYTVAGQYLLSSRNDDTTATTTKKEKNPTFVSRKSCQTSNLPTYLAFTRSRSENWDVFSPWLFIVCHTSDL